MVRKTPGPEDPGDSIIPQGIWPVNPQCMNMVTNAEQQRGTDNSSPGAGNLKQIVICYTPIPRYGTPRYGIARGTTSGIGTRVYTFYRYRTRFGSGDNRA
jgi:hypothetical protein